MTHSLRRMLALVMALLLMLSSCALASEIEEDEALNEAYEATEERVEDANDVSEAVPEDGESQADPETETETESVAAGSLETRDGENAAEDEADEPETVSAIQAEDAWAETSEELSSLYPEEALPVDEGEVSVVSSDRMGQLTVNCDSEEQAIFIAGIPLIFLEEYLEDPGIGGLDRIDGGIAYDPETNTLTLSDFELIMQEDGQLPAAEAAQLPTSSVDGQREDVRNSSANAVFTNLIEYTGLLPLTINLEGDNVLEYGEDGILSYGSDITIKGSGSLTIGECQQGISNNHGDITVQGSGSLTLRECQTGIDTHGLTINGSNTVSIDANAENGDACGIMAFDVVTFDGPGKLEIRAKGSGIDINGIAAKSFVMKNGTVDVRTSGSANLNAAIYCTDEFEMTGGTLTAVSPAVDGGNADDYSVGMFAPKVTIGENLSLYFGESEPGELHTAEAYQALIDRVAESWDQGGEPEPLPVYFHVEPKEVVEQKAEESVETPVAPAAPAAPAPSGTVLPTMIAEGSNALKLAWLPVQGVDGYDVFMKLCGRKGEFEVVASLTGGDAANATLSGLAARTCYKVYLRAWVMENGAKKYVLDPSPRIHAVTGGGARGVVNADSVTLKKKAMTLKIGKSARIKATVKGVKKGKVLNHVNKLRYLSSDPAVATVSAKGRVKGVGAGSCVIYVYTNNGIWTTLSVTVDDGPSKVQLAKTGKSLKVGGTLNLGAKVKLTPAKAKAGLSWTSSNAAVAAVDESGVVTGLKKGSAVITVTADNGKKAKLKIKVK